VGGAVVGARVEKEPPIALQHLPPVTQPCPLSNIAAKDEERSEKVLVVLVQPVTAEPDAGKKQNFSLALASFVMPAVLSL
jgi:hypothetical protein